MSLPSSANLTRPHTKNRFLAAIIHIPWYNGRSGVVLARDTGMSPRELRLILRGQKEPSYQAVVRIAKALNEHSKVPLPLEELIVDANSSFPTPFVCELFDCHCLPPWAHGSDGTLLDQFEGIPPGQWTFQVPDSSNPS